MEKDSSKKLDIKEKEIEKEQKHWNETTVKHSLNYFPERKNEFKNSSNINLKAIYTPLELNGISYLDDLGFPGEYPFTRGAQSTSYRSKLWTMRQFAGLGNAQETNKRFHYLIDNGQTGLSVAFHLPTIYGYESSHKMSMGEVGKEGVAIDTLADMEMLFDKIDLSQISTSMTINAPAAILLCMYIAVGEKKGIPAEKLTGTIQNDIFKEYQAQKSYVFPPEPSIRLIVDTIEYCTKNVPKWNTISISGYHIREAGATAIQELAFTLANGLAYVEACLERGLKVDDFTPRLSFFFNSHNNFFEEIAKFRAARRIWAKHLKNDYGAMDKKSLRLRFHTQTAGVSLTAQEPQNNIIRVTLQGLAAVLGGTQSLHTNSYDEALALPSEEAVKIALRTQQIIAHESGVADVIDPLAGSYFLESLTNKMEEKVEKYLKKIKSFGDNSILKGTYVGIKNNFYQQEIANSSYQFQQDLDNKKEIQVGVNMFKSQKNDKFRPELLKISKMVEKNQIIALNRLKAARKNDLVSKSLTILKQKAQTNENLLPFILDAVKAYCSVGEIMDVLREIFGTYKEDSIF